MGSRILNLTSCRTNRRIDFLPLFRGYLVTEGGLGRPSRSRGPFLAADRLLTTLGRFHQPRQEIVDAVAEKEMLVEQVLALGGGYGKLCQAFAHFLTESTGKVHQCNDTPRHLFYLDTIGELFPETRVVGRVRDPRDFVGSHKHFWQVASERDWAKVLNHPVTTSLLSCSQH